MIEKDLSSVIKDIVQKVSFLKMADEAKRSENKKEKHNVYNREIESFLKRSCDKKKFNPGKVWNVEKPKRNKNNDDSQCNTQYAIGIINNNGNPNFVILKSSHPAPSKEEVLNWVDSVEKDTQNFLKKHS